MEKLRAITGGRKRINKEEVNKHEKDKVEYRRTT
jgi:hypothetical protein